MIYLDNAATSYPKPQAVHVAVSRAMRDFAANPGRSGYPMAVRTTQGIYRCRETAAAFFGAAGAECVIFQPGCTQALNQVIHGYVKPGDHILLSDLEHNAVARPIEQLKKIGVSSTVVTTVPGDDNATLDAFRQAIRENTVLAVCTQASNVFGMRLPVERIAALCHQYGVKLCVDAAQSAGHVPIHVMDDGIDFLCCAGHKGLLSPMGVGLLILRDPNVLLEPLTQGGTGTHSKSLAQPEEPPERYESGTLNVPGIFGLQAGLDFLRSRDEERLWRDTMQKTGYLYEKLSKIGGVRLYTPYPEIGKFLPVLSCNLEGMESEQAGAELAKYGIAVRCGLHCAPLAHEKLSGGQGTIRFSPSAFTKKEELDFTARCVERVRKKTN